MKHFEYVTKKEYGPVKEELINLIRMVQDDVREHFTFRYDFIGSASRNMITREVGGNVGYDFDVNIRVNDPDNKYTAKKIRNILKAAFDKHGKLFSYDNAEDSKRVLTIKVKDKKNSKILHGCDFAVVNDYVDDNGYECQEYIHFNKSQNTYEWQEQPDGYYLLNKRIADIKEYGYWQEVRKVYLEKKCKNNDLNKKSRAIFAETIKEVHERHFE
ncbi:MAG: hypothetical protein BWX74_00883 [Tenericutes bacterium ADurb.Bin087]|jgi:hypothetical protein|nr:MAG: hypothetical protein BWX74_00883 [Tenericutes bacterium ADurb.Bin087]